MPLFCQNSLTHNVSVNFHRVIGSGEMGLNFAALFSDLVVFTFLIMLEPYSEDNSVPIGLLEIARGSQNRRLSLTLLSDTLAVISISSYRLEVSHLFQNT